MDPDDEPATSHLALAIKDAYAYSFTEMLQYMEKELYASMGVSMTGYHQSNGILSQQAMDATVYKLEAEKYPLTSMIGGNPAPESVMKKWDAMKLAGSVKPTSGVKIIKQKADSDLATVEKAKAEKHATLVAALQKSFTQDVKLVNHPYILPPEFAVAPQEHVSWLHGISTLEAGNWTPEKDHPVGPLVPYATGTQFFSGPNEPKQPPKPVTLEDENFTPIPAGSFSVGEYEPKLKEPMQYKPPAANIAFNHSGYKDNYMVDYSYTFSYKDGPPADYSHTYSYADEHGKPLTGKELFTTVSKNIMTMLESIIGMPLNQSTIDTAVSTIYKVIPADLNPKITISKQQALGGVDIHISFPTSADYGFKKYEITIPLGYHPDSIKAEAYELQQPKHLKIQAQIGPDTDSVDLQMQAYNKKKAAQKKASNIVPLENDLLSPNVPNLVTETYPIVKHDTAFEFTTFFGMPAAFHNLTPSNDVELSGDQSMPMYPEGQLQLQKTVIGPEALIITTFHCQPSYSLDSVPRFFSTRVIVPGTYALYVDLHTDTYTDAMATHYKRVQEIKDQLAKKESAPKLALQPYTLSESAKAVSASIIPTFGAKPKGPASKLYVYDPTKTYPHIMLLTSLTITENSPASYIGNITVPLGLASYSFTLTVLNNVITIEAPSFMGYFTPNSKIFHPDGVYAVKGYANYNGNIAVEFICGMHLHSYAMSSNWEHQFAAFKVNPFDLPWQHNK